MVDFDDEDPDCIVGRDMGPNRGKPVKQLVTDAEIDAMIAALAGKICYCDKAAKMLGALKAERIQPVSADVTELASRIIWLYNNATDTTFQIEQAIQSFRDNAASDAPCQVCAIRSMPITD